MFRTRDFTLFSQPFISGISDRNAYHLGGVYSFSYNDERSGEFLQGVGHGDYLYDSPAANKTTIDFESHLYLQENKIETLDALGFPYQESNNSTFTNIITQDDLRKNFYLINQPLKNFLPTTGRIVVFGDALLKNFVFSADVGGTPNFSFKYECLERKEGEVNYSSVTNPSKVKNTLSPIFQFFDTTSKLGIINKGGINCRRNGVTFLRASSISLSVDNEYVEHRTIGNPFPLKTEHLYSDYTLTISVIKEEIDTELNEFIYSDFTSDYMEIDMKTCSGNSHKFAIHRAYFSGYSESVRSNIIYSNFTYSGKMFRGKDLTLEERNAQGGVFFIYVPIVQGGEPIIPPI